MFPADTVYIKCGKVAHLCHTAFEQLLREVWNYCRVARRRVVLLDSTIEGLCTTAHFIRYRRVYDTVCKCMLDNHLFDLDFVIRVDRKCVFDELRKSQGRDIICRDVTHVRGGDVSKEPITVAPTIPSQRLRIFSRCIVAGTFDNLHNGHRLLLHFALCHTTEWLRVYVSDDAMMKHKTNPEWLETVEKRRCRVRDFMMHQFAAQPAQLRRVQIGVLHDTVGAAGTADFDALVVTSETARGGHIVNHRRLLAGLPEVEILVLDVLENNHSGAKISSSSSRARMHEHLTERIHEHMTASGDHRTSASVNAVQQQRLFAMAAQLAPEKVSAGRQWLLDILAATCCPWAQQTKLTEVFCLIGDRPRNSEGSRRRWRSTSPYAAVTMATLIRDICCDRKEDWGRNLKHPLPLSGLSRQSLGARESHDDDTAGHANVALFNSQDRSARCIASPTAAEACDRLNYRLASRYRVVERFLRAKSATINSVEKHLAQLWSDSATHSTGVMHEAFCHIPKS